jgi:Cysteine rich repeat
MHTDNNQIRRKRFGLPVGLLAAAVIQAAGAQQATDPQAALLNMLRAACQNDVQTLCNGVQPGGGRIISCLMQHKDQVSDGCKQAFAKAKQAAATQQQNSGQPSQSQPQGAGQTQSQQLDLGEHASQSQDAAPSQSQSEDQAPAGPRRRTSAKDSAQAGSPHYFRMKRATIDDKADNVPAAVAMMIPTTWQLQGSIRTMGGLGGCFADLESVSIHAQSADGSLVFEAMPNLTWEYADDPQTISMMTQEGQGFAKAGMKSCPVIPPQRAADFLQKIIPKYYPDAHIVSVAADPALDQYVREHLGLSLKGGSNDSSVRTDAAIARLEYQHDGRTMEQWVTVGEWMRAYPSGRGNVYDCHATMLMSFSAPKGQLDGNESLFRLMAFNISHDPQWDAHINGMIAKLYQQQQVEEAKRSQIIANFQKQVADTVGEVTANAQRGADQAAFGEDQIVRGVQTFRNPETGQTFELSNLHDHAWLSGDNQYVMSDDPNFNPNGQVDGSWTQLEPVQAQP